MEEFPANSQRAKARSENPAQGNRPEKIERVTSVEASRRRRGVGRQFKETFIGGSARMAFEYMLSDVVIPAIQNTLIDAFQGGIERLIRGESTRPRRSITSSEYSNLGHVDYRRMSAPPQTSTSSTGRMLSRRSRATQNFDEIIIPSRVEATDVIDRMFELLSRQGVVLVADLYEMTGIQSSHTDHKWGWTNLRGAKVSRMRSGDYLLDLPEPEALG